MYWSNVLTICASLSRGFFGFFFGFFSGFFFEFFSGLFWWFVFWTFSVFAIFLWSFCLDEMVLFLLSENLKKQKKENTAKPEYNGHPWDLKKVAVWKRCLIKVIIRLVVDESKRPLLTGGHYSQVFVKSGLTVI